MFDAGSEIEHQRLSSGTRFMKCKTGAGVSEFSTRPCAVPCMQAQRQLTRRLGSADAGRAVGSYLDAQLAAIGQLDPRFSCLRPFSAVLLRLGNGKAIRQPDGDSQRRLVPSVQSILLAGAASQARLQQLQAAAVAAEFRIMGGALAVALGQSVTHVLGLVLARAPLVVATDEGSSTGAASAVEPQALLRAVDDQAGGPPAVALLKLGLATGSIQLETDRCAPLVWPAGGDAALMCVDGHQACLPDAVPCHIGKGRTQGCLGCLADGCTAAWTRQRTERQRGRWARPSFRLKQVAVVLREEVMRPAGHCLAGASLTPFLCLLCYSLLAGRGQSRQP